VGKRSATRCRAFVALDTQKSDRYRLHRIFGGFIRLAAGRLDDDSFVEKCIRPTNLSKPTDPPHSRRKIGKPFELEAKPELTKDKSLPVQTDSGENTKPITKRPGN
jgi:hypothetical protein